MTRTHAFFTHGLFASARRLTPAAVREPRPPASAILVGKSVAIERLRATIERIATAQIAVLIEGPTGSGKELVAALLHQLSGRSGAFVAFNVCAIADTMFEDALFGHVRGAYTGAGTDTPGFLREAHGGTLFLDEIGGLPLSLQPKLLRAIETGVFRPIGSSRDAKSEFRLVAATNEPIDDLVDTSRFRPDLAHRVSGVVLRLPPLDERRDDIPHLVAHFATTNRLDAAALACLQARQWPGNVRELKQVIDAALVFGRGALDARSVEMALAHRPPPRPTRRVDHDSNYLSIERARLVEALERESWNTLAVAESLGVHRSTLYRRLRRLEIGLPPVMRSRPRQNHHARVDESTEPMLTVPRPDDSNATRARHTAVAHAASRHAADSPTSMPPMIRAVHVAPSLPTQVN